MRRALAAMVTLALGCTLVAPLCQADNLSSYQAQEQAAAQQLQAAQGKYNQAMATWRTAVNHLDQINAQLYTESHTLQTLTSERTAAQKQLDALTAQVAAATKVVAADKAKANQGLVTIDEHGSVSFVGVLLGSGSYADFLTRLSYLQRLWTMEVGVLRQAQADEAHLAKLQQAQAAEVTHIKSLQTEAAATVASLTAEGHAATAAKNAANGAVADAADAVQQVIELKNGLEAKIQQILAALHSGTASWPDVLADIQSLAKQFGIDPLLVEAVVLQESGGQSGVQSSAGAMGLMQLMPGTAAALGVSNAYDPVQNLTGGITYLLQLLDRFNGNIKLALAAYNAGPGAVQEYNGVPPYAETQRYVNDVLALYNEGK